MSDSPPLDYKIALENFAGPMDLLLYLIRKEEIEVHDIPIARILDQYMAYLELIKAVDLDEAGDFLVMASTLMVIKSKMLLPIEEVDLAEELDPRYELVQQLLEYKNTKTRARSLQHRAEDRHRRVGRPETARPEPRVEEDRTLDELQIWDLFRYFEKVISETRIDAKKDRIIEGRVVPVREYATRIERRILEEGPIFLSQIVNKEQPRSEVLGFFLAVLLLVKTQAISMIQGGEFGDIKLIPKELDGENVEQEIELADDFRN